MTERKNIVDGMQAPNLNYGLVYTKKCGWVDLGHANPVGGASVLWDNIRYEKGKSSTKAGYHRIVYSQKMGNKYVKVGVKKTFDIKRGLKLQQKKSIALAIFLDVSKRFETMQGGLFWRFFTNSSFSAEDLVSNLIGFYRAVEPQKSFLQICEPVSKEEALTIWDTYGSVDSNKNYTIVPYIYPTSFSKNLGPMSSQLPPMLRTIKPANQGVLFYEVK